MYDDRPARTPEGNTTPPVRNLIDVGSWCPGAACSILLPFVLLLAGCTAPSARGQEGAVVAMQPGPALEEADALRDRPRIPPTTEPWVCPDTALSPSFEPTLFVAPDGSDSNDGSEDRPLATLQAAADRVRPGDVVWLRGGEYSAGVVFETSGTEGAPIVVESYPGECAVLDGSSLGEGRTVTLQGVRHMMLRNLVVRNSPGEGIYMVESHDNRLSNLRLHDNFYSGVTSLDGDRNLFTYVISHDNADARGGDADGISISSGDRNHLAYCVVHDNSDDGVDTWRATATLVERCIAFRNGGGRGNGNGFKAGGERPSADTVVRYSVALANRSNGFDYNGGRDVAFLHDTAFANGGYGFVASGATLHNNLAVGNENGAWYGEVGRGVSEANSWQQNLNLASPARGASAGAVESLLSALPVAEGVGALAAGESIRASFRIDVDALLD